MKRGCEQVLVELDAIAAKPTGEALKAVGMALVMKVGGASGPLYGSFFMAMGKKLGERHATIDLLPEVFAAGVEAVAARGKSRAGEKTMLDVLTPVRRRCAQASRSAPSLARCCGARGGLDRTHARHEGSGILSRRAQRGPHGSRRSLIANPD